MALKFENSLPFSISGNGHPCPQYPHFDFPRTWFPKLSTFVEHHAWLLVPMHVSCVLPLNRNGKMQRAFGSAPFIVLQPKKEKRKVPKPLAHYFCHNLSVIRCTRPFASGPWCSAMAGWNDETSVTVEYKYHNVYWVTALSDVCIGKSDQLLTPNREWRALFIGSQRTYWRLMRYWKGTSLVLTH